MKKLFDRILHLFLVSLNGSILINKTINSFSKDLRVEIPVLTYHSINESVLYDSDTIKTSDFNEQIEYLSKHYEIVALDKYFEPVEKTTNKKRIALTFDDAFSGFYTNAFPKLKNKNIPATLFVPVGFVGQVSSWDGSSSEQIMTWDQIREVSGEGVSIGSHTLTHPDLSTLSIKQAKVEIYESKQRLEQEIGKTVRFFAYPYGRPVFKDKKIMDIVRDSGYEYAFSTRFSRFNSLNNKYFLNRIGVSNTGFKEDFYCKLNGDDDWREWKIVLKGFFSWKYI